MAINLFKTGGSGNWNSTASWSLGAVPTQNDGNVATFDATSPNCTMNVAGACNNIDFTNYTNTITMTNSINVYGNVTLGSGMLISGSGALNPASTGTLTSNGKTWPNALNLLNALSQFTLSGNWVTTGLVTTTGAGQKLNATTTETFTCNGGFNCGNGMTGTATIILQGGNVYSAVALSNSLTISGNITLTNNFILSCNINYISGTITSAGQLVTINSGFSMNGFGANVIQNLLLQGSGTTTLTGNISCKNLTIGTGSNALVYNGFNITCTSLNSTLTSGSMTGTTTITLNQLGLNVNTGISNTITVNTPASNIITSGNWNTAGNWSQGSIPTATDGYITKATGGGTVTVNALASVNALDLSGFLGTLTMTNGINSSGNITIGSTFTVSGASALTINGSGILTSNGKTWTNQLSILGTSQTYYLNGNWTNSGLVVVNGTGSTAILNQTATESLICNGGITMTSPITGTALITLGGGTWQSSGQINNNLTLAGNSIISGIVFTSNNTFTYSSGTITTTGSTIKCSAGNITLNLGAFQPNNLWIGNITGGTFTTTLQSDITCTGQLRYDMAAATVNMSGAYNISCATLNWAAGGGSTINLSGNITVSGLTTFNKQIGTINNNTIYMNGGLSVTDGVTYYTQGTTAFILGGGTWSGTSTANIINNLTVAGNVTISGNVYYRGGILAYSSGSLTTTGSTLNITGSTTIDWGNQTLNNITLTTNATTVTLNSGLKVAGALTATVSSSANHNKFQSNVGGTQRALTLLNGSSVDLSFVDATDIDSSGGLTVWTYKGTLSNTKNWNLLTYPISIGEFV